MICGTAEIDVKGVLWEDNEIVLVLKSASERLMVLALLQSQSHTDIERSWTRRGALRAAPESADEAAEAC